MNKSDFLPIFIKSDTFCEAWSKVKKIFKNEDELYNLVIHIKNPKKELPNELKNFENKIAEWVKEFQKPVIESKILPFTHGQRIYRWGKERKDQFGDYIIPLLKSNKKTRRAVIVIRDPSSDCNNDKPVPAPQVIQFTIVKQKIHITAYYRAQEMYLFWPINIFELIDLQNMVCNIVENINPGSITTISSTAYLKPSDFPRISIEMFELSVLSKDELKSLLNSALIEKRHDAINNLIQKLTIDIQKVERKTSLEIKGFKRLREFIQKNKLQIGDLISKKFIIKIDEIINIFSILEEYLIREISSEATKEKIKACQGKMIELIDIVKILLNPKVFIASTKYGRKDKYNGLQDIRARLPMFLMEIGFSPIYYESPDFNVPQGHSHDICLDAIKNCDIFLLIIGPRYGGEYSGSKYPEMKNLSITHAETRLAAKLNRRIYSFIRQNIFDERKTYKDNIKKRIKIEPSFAESKVFTFIDEILKGWRNEQGAKVNSWNETFNTIKDLEEKVKDKLKSYISSKDNEK